MKVCLLAVVLMVTACTTSSYYKDSNTLVTVKRFAGIPYLEKQERVIRKQPGSDSVPVK